MVDIATIIPVVSSTLEDRIAVMERRQNAVDDRLKRIETNTKDIIDIFVSIQEGTSLLAKLVRGIKWLGGVAIAIYGIVQLYHVYKSGW